MNMRIAIAKWLAPEWEEMERQFKWTAAIDRVHMTAMAESEDKHTTALQRIARCETPKASHTVRKMAKIAKEAL